jgi:hypothetical protein
MTSLKNVKIVKFQYFSSPTARHVLFGKTKDQAKETLSL